MAKALKFYLIQNDPNELAKALNSIQDGFNIIYSSCKCFFSVGRNRIKTKLFDTCLYNEEDSVMILFQKGDDYNKSLAIEYLEYYDKPYGEVSFMDTDRPSNLEDDTPEFTIVCNKEELEMELAERKESGDLECNFLPYIAGNMHLNYATSDGAQNFAILEKHFYGVIQFRDKTILIVSDQDERENDRGRNISVAKTISLVKKKGIKINIVHSAEPDIGQNNVVRRREKKEAQKHVKD